MLLETDMNDPCITKRLADAHALEGFFKRVTALLIPFN